MKIAVTSQNFKTITSHAGKTRRFIIFESDSDGGNLAEVSRLDLPKDMSMHEFHGTDHPLDEMDVLITGSCGSGFINRMAAKNVKVVTTSQTAIEETVRSYVNGQSLPPAVPHDH